MKSPIAAVVISLLLPLVYAQASPPAGRYSGILRFTKHVDGLTVTATARAVATVGSDGGLTIVLATAESPLPDVDGPSTTPSDVLRTIIAADNTCVIPGKPKPAIAPPPETSGVTVRVYLPSPVFRGTVRENGNSFSLTYTNVPTNYSYSIAPMDFTEFTYTFRRLSR
jgi:hypothetical protein